MFNVTILKMKDVVKYFIGILLTIVIIITIGKNFNKTTRSKENIVTEVQDGIKSFSQNNMVSCIDKAMPVVANVNKEYNQIYKENDGLEKQELLKGILKTQFSSIEKIENQNNVEISKAQKEERQNTKDNTDSESTENKQIQENKIETAETDLKTQVITDNPIKESFNVEYGKVKIKNQTNYELTQDMLKPDISIDNKNIVIFHTHSCESYTASDNFQYTPTGTFRTTDLNFTVTRVGTELENQLKQYNKNVIHNTSYHDYPSYNGSYTRSLATVENILKSNPSDIIIDLHRDAIGSRSDYAPSVKIGENDVAAQIMFVIGTNGGGLWHPNWNQNLKFAIKIQEKAEEMYPGLFKPIMLTNSRYNQHTGKYANIIEVGATGNTLDQCITSMKYLAKIMDEVIQ